MIIERSEYHNYFHLKKLLEIHDCPPLLYTEGNVDLLHKEDYKMLCVIGSRKNTSYGRDVVESLLRSIATEKIIILSGLALGIDSISHKEAIKNNLYTISIPGSGLDRDILHPQTNVNLANQIIEHGGLLMSERDPRFKATIWSFPSRNRIEAALSDAVLIIESEAKSGTQITARLALEYNKNIGVIPGSIFSPMSVGTIKLWHDGATPICDKDDILNLLGIKVVDIVDTSTNLEANLLSEIDVGNNLNANEKKILEILTEPIHKDVLIARSGLSFTDALITIITLEGKGYVKEEYGEIRKVR